ncbi:hypothetical protein Salat_0168000 [Sesamum alatum]|uniref:RNase H type-1 domain-containing protein n=1 Tax=Sesamum alatum TaxID=300844 RepID=A0AAE1YYB0_9LAMI|nr:hypothetical protein Salat_0168000 [Sesamum alatum]
MRGAIELAQRNNWPNVQFEGDCWNIIQKIREKKLDDSKVRPILEDALQLLAAVDNWDISHTKREGNCVAHLMAHEAKTNKDCNLLLSDDVLAAIQADLSFD